MNANVTLICPRLHQDAQVLDTETVTDPDGGNPLTWWMCSVCMDWHPGLQGELANIPAVAREVNGGAVPA